MSGGGPYLDHLIWDVPTSPQFDSGEPVSPTGPHDSDGPDTLIGPPADVDALAAVPLCSHGRSSEADGSCVSPAVGAPTAVPAGDAHITSTHQTEREGAAGDDSGPDLDGDHQLQGTPAGTTGCRCSHSRTWHSRYGVCCHDGCLCDRYAP